MKRFFIDAILSLMFILSLLFLFNSVKYFKAFDLFDPIGDMFADFDMTDMVISHLREAPRADQNILLVNIGDLDRAGIAEQLRIINKYDPKVIGIDALFDVPMDPYQDSLLAQALSETEWVVLGNEMEYNEEQDQFVMGIVPLSEFRKHAHLAYVNLITDAKTQEDMKVCRSFPPQEVADGQAAKAFSVKLASFMDPVAVQKFLRRGNSVELINYRGNVLDYGATRYGTRYFALDVQDVFGENFVPEIVKDKVVIFCYLGSYLGDRGTRIDKFFTPLNARYVGKTEPDMFGGVVHANIISMILNGDYIEEMNEFLAIVMAGLIGFLNILVFSYIYKALPNWYDGITKIVTLIEVLMLVACMILSFHHFNYKLNILYTTIIVLVASDALEVYYGVIKNLFSKEGRRELLKIKRAF